MTSRYPRLPDLVLLDKESRTGLIVGQTASMVFPVAKCCRVRADLDNGLSKSSPGTVIRAWYCSNCGQWLKDYRVGEALGVNDFETGPEGGLMLVRAVAQWTEIPKELIRVGITV